MQPTERKIKKLFVCLAVLLFWLGVWQGAFMLIKKPILIASPKDVFSRLVSLSQTGSFWLSIARSFLRILSGYALGLFGGALLAGVCCLSKTANALFSPIIKLARAVPVASFIILALVWMSKEAVPVFIVFLIVMPIVFQSVFDGVFSTDRSVLETAEVYGFSFFKRLRVVYFHSVLPFFKSGAISALGLAWKSGVAAEVLALPLRSIGYNLYRSKINIETADLFAWTAAVVILSVCVEKLVALLVSKAEKGAKKNK